MVMSLESSSTGLTITVSGIATKAKTEMAKPISVAICSGKYEKLEIASKEKRIILRSVNLVSPAARASRL